MKILTILGARPQFIKAGAVSREIKRQKEEGRRLKEIVVHTGQHYDANMSDIFFEELHLPKPDYFLGIGGKSHGAMTGQMMEKIEEVALKEKADIIMVYGDTNSTLAGALVGAKLHIPIAHVEAGLRSFNMNMPEEINRILTDRVSKWLFCPTETAVNNLKKEGFPFPTYQSTNTPITNNQKLETKNYQLILTHDVDELIMWKSWKQVARVVAGDILKRRDIKLAFSRIAQYFLIKQDKIKDPFDTFDWLMDKSESVGVKSRFYFMSGGVTQFDNRYKIDDEKTIKLINHIKNNVSKYYAI